MSDTKPPEPGGCFLSSISEQAVFCVLIAIRKNNATIYSVICLADCYKKGEC